MRKITPFRLKPILIGCFTLFIGMFCSNAQTSLTLGDIAIVGYNADETTEEDQFSFILLTDIVSGTVINFTDFGWCSGADFTGFQTANSCGANTGALSDGAITWTANTDLSCGTQIKVICGGASLSATSGAVTGLVQVYNLPGEYMSLAAGGDQIFAFQGAMNSPIFITGINMNGDWDATLGQCDFNSTFSTRPTTLNTNNSVAITPEVDNAIYNCVVTNDLPNNLRSAIFNVSNWNVDNTNAFTMPLSCSFSCAPLSVDEFNLEGKVSIYPNPASDILNVKIDKSVTFKELKVYSSLGNVIRTETKTNIDIKGVSKGIYYLEIVTSHGRTSKHVVIQ